MCDKTTIDEMSLHFAQQCKLLNGLFKAGITQETYVKINDVFWNMLKEEGYTHSTIAVLYDCGFRRQIGEKYSWADVLVSLNTTRNKHLDEFHITLVVHPFEQAVLDQIRYFYISANRDVA